MTRGVLPIYHYDENGVYVRTEMLAGYTQPNGDVIYIVPINATFENPWWSESMTGLVAVFDEKMRVWHHIEDHRGEVWFNHRDEATLIKRIGNPADWGFRAKERAVGPYGDDGRANQ